MSRIARAWILGGTTEGVELVKSGVPCVYTSATDYGAQLAKEAGVDDARAGKLDYEGMLELIAHEGVKLVLDATHPYALEATENAQRAARDSGVPYMRVRRPEALPEDGCTFFSDAKSAARFLESTAGNILLTTGSKELGAFCTDKLISRLFVRVLPTSDVVLKCEMLGLSPRQIIALQGPFEEDMNEALIKLADARYLVTKDSGAEGGARAKLSACAKLGVKVIAIARQAERGEPVEAAAQKAKALLLGEYPRFPLWLELRGELAVVVGGGRVAQRRVKTLQSCGMNVRVISPEPLELAGIEHLARKFAPGDTEGARIVLAATNERAVNRTVGLEAKKNGAWVSVADNANEGNFHFPAFYCDANMAASVHTGEPAVTKRLMARLRSALEDADA